MHGYPAADGMHCQAAIMSHGSALTGAHVGQFGIQGRPHVLHARVHAGSSRVTWQLQFAVLGLFLWIHIQCSAFKHAMIVFATRNTQARHLTTVYSSVATTVLLQRIYCISTMLV